MPPRRKQRQDSDDEDAAPAAPPPKAVNHSTGLSDDDEPARPRRPAPKKKFESEPEDDEKEMENLLREDQGKAEEGPAQEGPLFVNEFEALLTPVDDPKNPGNKRIPVAAVAKVVTLLAAKLKEDGTPKAAPGAMLMSVLKHLDLTTISKEDEPTLLNQKLKMVQGVYTKLGNWLSALREREEREAKRAGAGGEAGEAKGRTKSEDDFDEFLAMLDDEDMQSD